jgi:hypothetical protein
LSLYFAVSTVLVLPTEEAKALQELVVKLISHCIAKEHAKVSLRRLVVSLSRVQAMIVVILAELGDAPAEHSETADLYTVVKQTNGIVDANSRIANCLRFLLWSCGAS